MDCRQGPPVTRRGLASALLLALTLAGCGGRNAVQFGSAGSPSTGVSTGGSLNVQGGASTLGTVIAIGVLAGVSARSDRDGMAPALRVPAMDPNRRVVERDCTKPIEDWSANLKCR